MLKKTLIIVVALSILVAGMAIAGVVSSKHDMRNYTGIAGRTISAGSTSTTTQVCVFCHHPHRGNPSGNTVSSILLWNISDANASYSTYFSPTVNATGLTSTGSVGTDTNAQYSLLCMGCHDGAATSNAYVRGSSVDGALGAVPTFGDIASNLGSTLVDDHPVDFDYPTTVQGATSGMSDIQIGSGGVVDGAITGVDYPLYGDTMQCATCHDVHNGNPGYALQFMRGGTTNVIVNSNLCRDCHTAK